MHYGARMMLVVHAGQRCAGFLFSRGPLGWEGFSATEELLGLFPSEHEAADAVIASTEPRFNPTTLPASVEAPRAIGIESNGKFPAPERAQGSS